MVRKQFFIDEATERALEDRAALEGVSQAELVREAIAALLEKRQDDAARAAAWDSILSRAERIGRMEVAQRSRDWTREELHDRSHRD